MVSRRAFLASGVRVGSVMRGAGRGRVTRGRSGAGGVHVGREGPVGTGNAARKGAGGHPAAESVLPAAEG